MENDQRRSSVQGVKVKTLRSEGAGRQGGNKSSAKPSSHGSGKNGRRTESKSTTSDTGSPHTCQPRTWHSEHSSSGVEWCKGCQRSANQLVQKICRPFSRKGHVTAGYALKLCTQNMLAARAPVNLLQYLQRGFTAARKI
eukprot:268272-Rhodomonas_salina.4